jgi:hypothetical protein
VLEEGSLCDRAHVESVRDAVALEVLEEPAFEVWVVVSVVERAGAAEEVDVRSAALVEEPASLGAVEDGREGATVASHLGFEVFEDVHSMFLQLDGWISGDTGKGADANAHLFLVVGTREELGAEG